MEFIRTSDVASKKDDGGVRGGVGEYAPLRTKVPMKATFFLSLNASPCTPSTSLSSTSFG